jgi:hypothetical protein
MSTTQEFTSDIPLRLAVSAFNGTSHSPEKRGAMRVAEYTAMLTSDFNFFTEQASKGGTLDKLDAELARYREGFKSRYKRWLYAHASVVSWFIAGPSKFPAARMNKRSRTADKRLAEVSDFRARARRGILRALRPDLAPIRPNDADAVERYQKELSELEYAQARMVAANKTIKKHAKKGLEAQIIALINEGFSPAQASKLMSPDFMGGIGFARYALSNNNANIRRVRLRIQVMEAYKEKAKGGDIEEQHGLCRIVQCFAENRVRIFTPGKPEYNIRTAFKKRGFIYSGKNNAWQRFCNKQSLEMARELVLTHYPQDTVATATNGNESATIRNVAA